MHLTALFALQACSEYCLLPGQGAFKMLAWGQAVARVMWGKWGICGKGEIFPEENQVQAWPCQCANSSVVVSGGRVHVMLGPAHCYCFSLMYPS